MVIFILLFTFLALGFIWHFTTRKYINPYKLIFIFGKKGSGKSTLLERLVSQYKRDGWTVYSTEGNQGVRPIDPRNLYNYSFPPHSAIFIDEVSLIWDNRDFKSMDKRIVEWFRLQRHHRCRVFLFSQTFDVDKKIRDLADEMYLVNRYARVFVVGKRIIRKPIVVHPSPEAPARIDEDLVVDGPLMALFGGRIFAFLPKWSKRFDSHKLETRGEPQVRSA